jgi:LEA14-like dessication related protein
MVKKLLVRTVMVVFAALSLTTCQTLNSLFQEPKLSLQSVEIAKLSFTGADLLCKVKVENPNSIDIPFPEIGWELFVNTNSFITGMVKNNKSLKPRKSTVIDVPVKFTYLQVFNTFASLKGRNEADYRVALAAKIPLPVMGDKIFKFDHNGVLPILHLPTLSFKGISLKNLGASKIDFDLSWEVENNNSFAMNVKDLSYNFAVNKTQWASGKAPGSPQIPAGRKTEIPLTISINSLSMVKDITEIIARGTDVSYVCNGNINIGAALPALNDFGQPFNFTGTTKLRK